MFLLLAEGISRWAGPQLPAWRGNDTGTVVMTGHPTRLWGMGSGVRQNAHTTATINEQGLRGPIPVTPRPSGHERVVVLGDSTYFGHGVEDDETMMVQLQNILQSRGMDVDVINGGIPGYSTEQTRMLLDELIWGYEPTLVIIGNLWSDNNFDHWSDADLLRTRSVFANNPLAQSAFFMIVAGTLDRLRGGEGAHIVTWTKKSEWPMEGVRRVPVKRYAQNLDEMVRAARDHNCGAAIMSPVNKEQAEKRDGEMSWNIYFDVQKQVAEHHQIPLIRPRPTFEKIAAVDGGDALFSDEMHPTARGHAEIAKVIAEALQSAGWASNRLLAKGDAFDYSMIEDTAPPGHSETANSRSPQSNLFESDEGGSDAQQGNPQSTNQRPGWKLRGEIKGGSGEVRIDALSKDGITLGSATVPKGEGPYELTVMGEEDVVSVKATCVNGGQATGEAGVNNPMLDLTIQ